MDDGTRRLPVLPAVVASGLVLDDALTALEQVQLVKAAAAALEHRLLARVDELDELDDAPDVQWHREQVSPILRCAPRTAHGRLAMATTLVRELPQTLAALETGRLTPGHATAVLDAVAPLDAAMSAQLEARVLRRCEDTSVAEFRARCRRAVLTVDPAGAKRRHDEAKKRRDVQFRTEDNGMATLRAYLAADEAARARQYLNAGTDAVLETETETGDDHDATETRSRDAVRADVLVDLLTASARDDSDDRELGAGPGARHGSPIQVTIAFSTLTGLDDLPGDLDGEPVTATLARTLANDPNAWWRPILIDRDGHLDAVAARTYKPGAALARHTRLHDRTCQFIGCRRPAMACELDHAIPFNHDNPEDGGLTEIANLHALCKRHHRLKHEAGWTITRKHGTTTWRSPTGRHYRKPIEPYLDPVPPDETEPDPPEPDPPPF